MTTEGLGGNLYCSSSFLRRPASVKVNEKPRRPITSATTPTSDNDMFDSPGVLGELGRPEGFFFLCVLFLFFKSSARRSEQQPPKYLPLYSHLTRSAEGDQTCMRIGVCVLRACVSACLLVSEVTSGWGAGGALGTRLIVSVLLPRRCLSGAGAQKKTCGRSGQRGRAKLRTQVHVRGGWWWAGAVWDLKDK